MHVQKGISIMTLRTFKPLCLHLRHSSYGLYRYIKVIFTNWMVLCALNEPRRVLHNNSRNINNDNNNISGDDVTFYIKADFFWPRKWEKRKWREIRFSKIGREIEILKRNKVMQELLWTLFWTAGFKREGFERVPREIRNVLVTGLLLLIATFHASESDWVWIFNEQVVGLSLQNFFVSLDMELFSGMRLRLALAQVVTSCRYDQPPKHFTTCEMATFHTCLTIGTIHLLISFF